MSKLLLSCDEFLYFNNGEYYVANKEKYDFFQRYLRVFDTLKIVCRCEEELVLKHERIKLSADSRIDIVPIPMFHGPVQYACRYFRVEKVIKNVCEDCDTAILRIPSTIAMQVWVKVKEAGLPYACEVVYDAGDGWKSSHGINRLIWKQIDKTMKSICLSANGVSCVTEKYLQQYYYSMREGSFSSYYSSLSLDKSFYGGPRFLPNHSPIVIAHVSNFVNFDGRKGIKEVIQAISLLSKKKSVKAIFVGEDRNNSIPRLLNYAEKLGVKQNVEFLGRISREELDNFLTNSDLFVFPTKAEGLPRVLIEAIAKGLPCITTPVSGNAELIQEKFLIDHNDIEGLASCIELLIEDKDLYEETSRRNYNHSLQFESSILEMRRDIFYKSLKEETMKNN